MRALVLVVVVALVGACSTVRPIDREATAIGWSAVGGGFVATGSVTLAGAAVSAAMAGASVVAAAVPSDLGGPLLMGAAVGGALGGAQIVLGLVLIRQARCAYQGDECPEAVAKPAD